MFIYKLYRVFLTLLGRGVLLTAIVPLACCAKAWTAKKLGDNTAERDGRLTMNFRRHVDLYGIILMLCLGFGWGKDMNIDASKVKNMKRDITLINLAPAVVYFLMYVLLKNIAGFIYSISLSSVLLASIYMILTKAARTSMLIGIITLLPIPPLEGFHIFYQFSWAKFRRWYLINYQKVEYWSRYVLLGIIFMDVATDGEFSLIGLFRVFWSLILDNLVFFNIDYFQIPMKVLDIVFG